MKIRGLQLIAQQFSERMLGLLSPCVMPGQQILEQPGMRRSTNCRCYLSDYETTNIVAVMFGTVISAVAICLFVEFMWPILTLEMVWNRG